MLSEKEIGMNKLLAVIIVIVAIDSFIYGEDVLQQFIYTDNHDFVVPLYMPDDITPIPDGTIFRVVIGSSYDNTNPYALNNNFYEDHFNGDSYGVGTGFFLTETYFKWEESADSPPEPVANCGEDIYLEIVLDCGVWDTNKHVRHSEIITGPAAGAEPSEYETTWLPWETETSGPCLTLISFQASLQGQLAVITWITASESDLRNFNLYRDGILIHQEDATNSSETVEYTFIDETVENHTTYNYTLEAVNFDGVSANIGSVDLTVEFVPTAVLSEFTAEYTSETVFIYWTTQSENENLGWNIYRGESGDAFQNEATIKINNELIEGQETTTVPHEYQFVDEYAVQPELTYWYWLESVNILEQTTVYNPIAITIPGHPDDPPEPGQWKLIGNYPNPFE